MNKDGQDLGGNMEIGIVTGRGRRGPRSDCTFFFRSGGPRDVALVRKGKRSK